jgi:hypothetical protein
MQGAREQRSEVARLLAQINSEYEAAQRGLFGTAAGSSRHDFITKRILPLTCPCAAPLHLLQ